MTAGVPSSSSSLTPYRPARDSSGRRARTSRARRELDNDTQIHCAGASKRFAEDLGSSRHDGWISPPSSSPRSVEERYASQTSQALARTLPHRFGGSPVVNPKGDRCAWLGVGSFADVSNFSLDALVPHWRRAHPAQRSEDTVRRAAE